MYIEKINGPEDVKKLNIEEMTALAEEMRHALLKRASIHGGHFGPNFGMVEAIIALHYVFESPKDKMVFDVSHQTYPHKMLTGRKDAYLYEEHYDDVSGYSNPNESVHDHFTVGHTSTSVSLACGLAKARDLKGEEGNVIAVIGDGSLSGGEALEGLDYAVELDGNLIIIVNDNDMSIAENHGGIYKNLRLLRETKGKSERNLFRAMGLDYVFVENGNDIPSLIDAFRCVKDSTIPVVVHIVTEKGRGYAPAVANKEQWHWCMPFDPETGKPLFTADGEDYGTITADFLMKKMASFIMWQLVCIMERCSVSYRRSIFRTITNSMRQDILLQESMSTARFTLTAKRTKNGMTAILMTWNLTLRWHLLVSLKNSKKLMMKISAARTSMMKTFLMMTRWMMSFMRRISGFLRIRSLHAKTCRNCRLQQKSVKISGYQIRRALHMHSMVQI